MHEITSKHLIPFSESNVLFEVIPGVLGRSVNFNITYRFLLRQPVFPDHLFLMTRLEAITIQITTRSSHQRCSVRKDDLRNFAKLTGKHLCQILFYNKIVGPEPATFLKKKRLWHRYFPMNFAKFLRTPFHKTPLDDCFSTIQHFLAENPSKVLNGQQQHKGVTFHWSRISPSLVKLF